MNLKAEMNKYRILIFFEFTRRRVLEMMMDFGIRRWMLDWATTASDVTCKFPCGYEVYNYKIGRLKMNSHFV